jgi:hypothetical protein
MTDHCIRKKINHREEGPSMKTRLILFLALIASYRLFAQGDMENMWSKPYALSDSLTDNVNCAIARIRSMNRYPYVDKLFVFWEKSADSTATEIWFGNLSSMSEPKLLLSKEHVHYQNPQIMNTWSDTTYYLFYETDENGTVDIYYKQYLGNDQFSESMPLITTASDDQQIRTSNYQIVWLRDGCIFSSYQTSSHSFSVPMKIDSLDCSYPVISDNGIIAWEKTTNDSAKILCSFEGNNHIWNPPDTLMKYGHNTHLKFSQGFNQPSVLCWQSQMGSNININLSEFNSSSISEIEVEKINLMSDYNQSEPSIHYVLQITKASNDSPPLIMAFVMDSISTEIYATNGWWYDFINLSQNGVPDRNPQIFEVYWGKVILVWESFVNNHWQLMASEAYYFIGAVDGNETSFPDQAELLPCYPNPFNGSTMIRYALPNPTHVRLTILDLLGREIDTLVNADQPSGTKTVAWTPRNLASGIYLIRIEAGPPAETGKTCFVKTRKLIFQK